MDVWDILLEITDLTRMIETDHPESIGKVKESLSELKKELQKLQSHER